MRPLQISFEPYFTSSCASSSLVDGADEVGSGKQMLARPEQGSLLGGCFSKLRGGGSWMRQAKAKSLPRAVTAAGGLHPGPSACCYCVRLALVRSLRASPCELFHALVSALVSSPLVLDGLVGWQRQLASSRLPVGEQCWCHRRL